MITKIIADIGSDDNFFHPKSNRKPLPGLIDLADLILASLRLRDSKIQARRLMEPEIANSINWQDFLLLIKLSFQSEKGGKA